MNSSTSILLRNGTVLVHDENDHVNILRNTDILIKDTVISKIGSNLDVEAAGEVIDCTDSIVTPGFISTHSHLWQSQLKGRFVDDTLFDYMPKGNFQGCNFSPSDFFLGQLAGCLEQIDVGTTSALDHAHGAYSVEHIMEALKATQASGLRTTYAYAETIRVDKWDQNICEMSQDLFNEERMGFIEAQAKMLNSSPDNQVSVGFAFDQWFMPPEYTQAIYKRMLAAGVRTFTTHIARNAVFGMMEQVKRIEDHGVLDLSKLLEPTSKDQNTRTNYVLSHCTGMDDNERAVITRPTFSNPSSTTSTFVSVSCTPETESQMVMRDIAVFDPAYTPDPSRPTHQPQVSLGVDCHSSNTSFMPALARTGLLNARIISNQATLNHGKYPSKLPGDCEGIFNMMTVNGANALGLGDKTGRIKEGYKADITVFDATSTGIANAAEFDPLIAVVRFSDIRDVAHVIVDGKFRKRDGKLLPVTVDGEEMSWDQIRKKLIASQRDVAKRFDARSIDKAKDTMVQRFYIDLNNFE